MVQRAGRQFVETERTTHGVDVPEDVEIVEQVLATRAGGQS